MIKQQFQIQGTHCIACKRLIEKKIGALDGVSEIIVIFESGETGLTACRILLKDELQKALEGMDYKII